ncbi:MAG: AbrB/MazE/SpoVT family DNA-binding domain-containing protein [bacterium]|nr:AbrB/MazE/SpoVT family DNA-binding domain-containing protein [bacterium]
MEWEITIDASGRVVIPKEVRRRHHLSGSSRLILVETDERLVLIPRRKRGTTVEKAGMLVFQGRLDSEFPDHRALREERARHLMGL